MLNNILIKYIFIFSQIQVKESVGHRILPFECHRTIAGIATRTGMDTRQIYTP